MGKETEIHWLDGKVNSGYPQIDRNISIEQIKN